MTAPASTAPGLDLAALVDDLFRLLRLKTTPIGMQLFETVEAMAAVPRIRRPKGSIHTTDQIVGQAARLGFTVGITVDDLWEAMQAPHANPKEFIKNVVPPTGYKPTNRVGDFIWVWSGRPVWDAVFIQVRDDGGHSRTEHLDVGVCFCGAKVIAKDLDRCCVEYSKNDGICFRFHKEHF